MTKETVEQKFPLTFPNKVYEGWTNGVKDWHIENATSGLYTLDVEHIDDKLVKLHNDPDNKDNIASRYRKDLCVHKCPACFNEESMVYSQEKRDLDGKLIQDTNTMKFVLIHELAHIIDPGAGTIKPAQWGKARKLDKKKFASEYAKTNSDEDFAESMVSWIVVRHKSDKISKSDVVKFEKFKA